MTCPECREAADFQGYRPTPVLTLLGKVHYSRPHDHCEHCHHGWFPTDAEFGLQGKRTCGAREVISLVGTLEPFEESGRVTLARLTG